jgi:hypothetical protein
MAHDVFISYSSKDKTVADAVCATLEQHQIRCWIAPRDIGPGQEWGESIVSAIQGSRVMVLIFSASANESPQIRREVERGVHNNVVIVPMRIEDVLPQKSLEYFIGSVHWLDAFSKPLETYLESLVAVVKGILGAPEPPRPPLPDPLPPKRTISRAVQLGAAAVIFLLIAAGLVALHFYQAARGDGTSTGSLANRAAAPAVNPPVVNRASAKNSGSARPEPVHLRSEKQTVSNAEAKAMVVTNNFFRANWNNGGKGVEHRYETKAVGSALVVLDHTTGLMWQRGGSGEVYAGQGDRKDADEYVRSLNAKKFAGFDDWRLPTLEEAMSLMSPADQGQPGEVLDGSDKVTKGLDHIDAAFEKDAAPIMWTSDLESPERAWLLYFWDGICVPESVNFNAYVRAVRTLKQ